MKQTQQTNAAAPAASVDNAVTAGATKVSASVIWSPVPNTDVGIEYPDANRTTEDGLSGHLDRVKASAKYTFQAAPHRLRGGRE